MVLELQYWNALFNIPPAIPLLPGYRGIGSNERRGSALWHNRDHKQWLIRAILIIGPISPSLPPSENHSASVGSLCDLGHHSQLHLHAALLPSLALRVLHRRLSGGTDIR